MTQVDYNGVRALGDSGEPDKGGRPVMRLSKVKQQLRTGVRTSYMSPLEFSQPSPPQTHHIPQAPKAQHIGHPLPPTK